MSLLLLRWLSAPAYAGMPFFSLSELASARFEAISFFLLVIAGCALAVQRLWNGLESAALPRLDYRRALGLVVLWGLLFQLVLTMISGARELMTPGAWEKRGATYALADDVQTDALVQAARLQRAESLRDALWACAQDRDGALPANALDPCVPPETWQILHPSGLRFLYRGGGAIDEPGAPLVAWEPAVYGDARYAVLGDGSVRALEDQALDDAIRALAQ